MESHHGMVQTNQLMYLSRQPYGEVIWMKKGQDLKSVYHIGVEAGKNPYQRASSSIPNQAVILQTTAAYTGDYALNTQLGIAMEQGRLKNKALAAQMDGLVLIWQNQVEVFNIRESFFFQPLNQRIELNDVYDRTRFLAWVEKNNGSLFQTHLLAFNQDLKITNVARDRVADRKLLVTLSKDGEEYFVLFHFARSIYLYDAAKMTLEYLTEKKNAEIHGIVNLDTGVHNVLELPEQAAHCAMGTLGKEHPQEAANLLTFFYQE